ncbi:MAG: hypothetical protein RRC34_13135 [Lentisphaeria bacterium]|nr:hypothetical protein [Lentisphaeria bacterium]
MRKLCIALTVLAASCCLADETPPPPPPPKDYSPGLEKMLTMGLPDLSEGKLVELHWSPPEIPLLRPSSPVSFYDKAWLLEENKDGLSRLFLVDGLCEVSLRKVKISEVRQPPAPGENPDFFQAFWNESNVDREAKRVLREFRNHLKEMESYDNTPPRGLEGMLLWAAMLHGNGKTAAANELAAEIFENSPDPRALLGNTISLITDGKYNGVMTRFRNSGSWQAYRDDLTKLLADNSRGWKRTEAALKLKQRLDKLLSDTFPPALPAEGGFSDSQRKAAQALLNEASSVSVISDYDPWLLSPPDSLRYGQKNSSLIQFLALQSDALPILAAWLEDDTPTTSLAQNGEDGMGGLGMDLSEMLSQVEDAQQRQAILAAMRSQGGRSNPFAFGGAPGMSLPAPQTRADLARNLCGGILPLSLHEPYRDDQPVTAEAVQAFMAQIKGKKGIELARYYFEEGTDNQRQSALEFMMAKGGDEDIKKVEQAILNSDEEYERLSMLGKYLVNQGEDGLEFAEKIAAAFDSDEARNQVRDTLKMMGLTEEKDPEKEPTFDEALTAFLAWEPKNDEPENRDDEDDERSLETLAQSFVKIPAKERIPALEKAVEKLGDEKNPKKAVVLAHLFGYARIQGGTARYSQYVLEEMKTVTWEEFLAADDTSREDGEEPGYSQFSPDWDVAAMLATIRANKDVWLKMINRKESFEENPFYGEDFTLGVLTAMTMHNLTVPDAKTLMDRSSDQIYALPDRGAAFWLKSAAAIIEGQTDTGLPLPAAEHVTAERKKELITSFKAKEGAELATFMKKLNDDEYLAFIDFSGEHDDEAVARKLARLATVIIQVDCDINDDNVMGKMKALEGEKVSTATAKVCLETVQEQVKKNVALLAVIQFSARGARLKVGPVPPSMTRRPGFGMGGGEKAGVMMNINCGSSSAYAMLPVEMPHGKQPEKKVGEDDDLDGDLDGEWDPWADDDGDQQEIWDILDDLEKGDLNPLDGYSMLHFMGIVPVK